MASVAEDLRSFLLSLPAIVSIVNDRIHQDHVPQTPLGTDGYFDPYLWLTSNGIIREECTNQPVGDEPEAWTLDVEAISSEWTIADALVDELRAIDGYDGAMGSRTVQAIFIDEQTDDYVPRGLRSDVGSYVKAVMVEIHRS